MIHYLILLLLFIICTSTIAILNIDCKKYGYRNQQCSDYIANYIEAYSGNWNKNSAYNNIPYLPQKGYNIKVLPPSLFTFNHTIFLNPNNKSDSQTFTTFSNEVLVDYQIDNIEGIDQISGTIKMDIVISMKWLDSRLAVNHSLLEDMRKSFDEYYSIDTVSFSSVAKEWVWFPTLSLLNSNGVFLNDFSWGDVQYYLFNGVMWLRGYGSVTATCELDLTLFPYDTQTCEFRFGSPLQNIFNGYNFTVNVDTTTNSNSPLYNPLIGPIFSPPTAWKYISSGVRWSQGIIEGPINFLTLQLHNNSLNIIQVTLQRYHSYYVTIGVLPLTALAVLSVIAMFIPSFEPRVVVLVTIVLVMVAIGWSVSTTLPVSKENTWLDDFGVMCLLFAVVLAGRSVPVLL